MSWRRLVIVAVILVLVSSVIGAIGTSQHLETGTAPTPLPDPAPAAGTQVAAELPAKDEVRATVGDVVRLTVRSKVADTAELPALGVESPVDALAPAQLVFVADAPGRFPVRLRDQDEAIGVLRVSAARSK